MISISKDLGSLLYDSQKNFFYFYFKGTGTGTNSLRLQAQVSSEPRTNGSRFKPKRKSSSILDPGYKRYCLRCIQCTSTKEPGPRFRCHATWWGLRATLLRFVTFNSSVKKNFLGWNPRRSGVPNEAQFSSLVHWKSLVIFLRSAYNFDSGRAIFFDVTQPKPFG